MGDIITTFSKIGDFYLEDEKRVKNKAYEYEIIKVYLFDIESKAIEPSLNISKEDLIYTDYGKSPRQGFLFPITHLDTKDVDKMIRGIITANKNLLSYFSQNEIFTNSILKILYGINDISFMKLLNLKFTPTRQQLSLSDYNYQWQEFQQAQTNFFENCKSKIITLEKEKIPKGKKGATYFALAYQGKPISAYFQDIYDAHLKKGSENDIQIYGYDMLSNEPNIGGDANLVFCSINELKISKKNALLKTIIQSKLLPLNTKNAQKVQIGFDVVKKFLTTNFYGLKMAIIPTLLSSENSVYKEVLELLIEALQEDNSINNIEDYEGYINEDLETIAKKEQNLPVLNTILFIDSPPASKKYDLLLQIDDVLPSYISHISDKMGENKIKAFKNKDAKDIDPDIIYMHNLFEDRLEIMNVLLSTMKLDSDILIHKFAELIYWGTMNKAYAHPVEWSKYFNGYYRGRSIEAIKRYAVFFNETNKLKESLILQKEIEYMGNNKQEKIEQLIKSSPFLNNEVLKSAYLLGMLSSALMNWQYGVSSNSSYEKWLNNSGMIAKDSLDRIWKKAEETIRKLTSTSGSGNKTVTHIKEILIGYLTNALMNQDIVKSSHVSLAFAMGGSDYNKHIKDTNTKKDEEN